MSLSSQLAATGNTPKAFLASAFMTQTSLCSDLLSLLTHKLTISQNDMQEKPENNLRIQINGTFRAGSNYRCRRWTGNRNIIWSDLILYTWRLIAS